MNHNITTDEDFFGPILNNDEFESAENRSLGADSVFSFDRENEIEVRSTPQNTRTMQSVSDEMFSPGSFFATKSGKLGDFENKDQTDRVISCF